MFWLTNNNNLSASLAALVVWGFLMAFLFNSMMWVIKGKKDNLLFFTSFMMFISYFISDHFYELFSQSTIYLTWFSFDVITAIVIISWFLFYKPEASPGFIYVSIGLMINSCLFLAMYIDLGILKTKNSWWLWDLYSAGINVTDFIMIVGLIVNKDYLGIIRFYKFITSPIRKKALS